MFQGKLHKAWRIEGKGQLVYTRFFLLIGVFEAQIPGFKLALHLRGVLRWVEKCSRPAEVKYTLDLHLL